MVDITIILARVSLRYMSTYDPRTYTLVLGSVVSSRTVRTVSQSFLSRAGCSPEKPRGTDMCVLSLYRSGYDSGAVQVHQSLLYSRIDYRTVCIEQKVSQSTCSRYSYRTYYRTVLFSLCRAPYVRYDTCTILYQSTVQGSTWRYLFSC